MVYRLTDHSSIRFWRFSCFASRKNAHIQTIISVSCPCFMAWKKENKDKRASSIEDWKRNFRTNRAKESNATAFWIKINKYAVVNLSKGTKICVRNLSSYKSIRTIHACGFTYRKVLRLSCIPNTFMLICKLQALLKKYRKKTVHLFHWMHTSTGTGMLH